MVVIRGNPWPKIFSVVGVALLIWITLTWIQSRGRPVASLSGSEQPTLNKGEGESFAVAPPLADRTTPGLEAPDAAVTTAAPTPSAVEGPTTDDGTDDQDVSEEDEEKVEEEEPEDERDTEDRDPETFAGQLEETDEAAPPETTTEMVTTTGNDEDAVDEIVRQLPFMYVPPPAAGLEGQGKRIQADRKLLRGIGIPRKSFVDLNARSVLDFVFVTGSHSRFFVASKDTVAGIQKFFPGYKIFYYDLGLKEDEIAQVKTWCNVEFRRLDYDKYPPHVREYPLMAYKPLIINELVSTHKAVLWMDPHFRAFRGNWTHVFEAILENDGIYLFKCTGIPGYVSTHPKLYKYFPADIEKYKVVGDYWAGGIFIYGTEAIYWNILYWWTICALDVNCIAPTDQYFCKKWKNWSNYVDRETPENTRWAKCHRFGQSVISLLTNNYFGYKGTRFTHFDSDPVASVIRNNTWMHDLKYCKP